ncbi:hypothetical protein F751_1679 [Auxenochlorella protothecoides]|uniref:Uncharacterized protein n=1 Tax=Auxenochlorella protothecoides TaxID=3075 RepID=A0A087SGE6_AUXPR|nr:hypothetical protein F751_1679 [Auxenochlorella protothecoides]KFM24800.1 hypothetical protein F751_1679 [Auxenochlorella protothecoides]
MDTQKLTKRSVRVPCGHSAMGRKRGVPPPPPPRPPLRPRRRPAPCPRPEQWAWKPAAQQSPPVDAG